MEKCTSFERVYCPISCSGSDNLSCNEFIELYLIGQMIFCYNSCMQ